MGLWSWTSAIWKMWRADTLCAICLWTLLLLHKIPSWDNKILEYYLSLYAWIMDVDIYNYFYNSTFFLPCKDPFSKIGIMWKFYRRNNIISIQVSQIPFLSPGPRVIGIVATFHVHCLREEDEQDKRSL